MHLLTVTNLYPRPDQPQRGTYNADLFRALDLIAGKVTNLCLVPEWRLWRWGKIRKWQSPSDDFTTRYVPVFYLPLAGRNISHLTYAACLRQYRSFADEADGILASWIYPDAVATAESLWDRRKPLIVKSHGSDRFHLKSAKGKTILKVLKSAKAVIANSGFLRESLIECGCSEDNTWRVLHGVDKDKFRPVPEDAALKMLNYSELENRKLILWVGNFKKDKRPDLMFNVFQQMTNKQNSEKTSLTLIMIGDGPEKEAVKASAVKAGIESKIILPGSLPPDQVALWMSAADCLCLTSITESMPNVLIEAYACGLPVAACSVGDVPVWLADHPDAGLIAPVDAEQCQDQLPDIIHRLLKSKKKPANRLVKTWRETAKEILAIMEGK